MESPSFLLDTSILLAHIRHKANSPSIYFRAIQQFGVPSTSELSVYEIEVGARKAGRPNEFATIFRRLMTFNVDRQVVLIAADLQVYLLKSNQIIGLPDTLIAATALAHNLPLLTLNLKHFSRIPNLQLLNLP